MWGIAAIESKGVKGVLVVVMVVLIFIEKSVFGLMMPAARDEIIGQNSECTGAGYYSPGCPGFPPPWHPPH